MTKTFFAYDKNYDMTKTIKISVEQQPVMVPILCILYKTMH